MADIIGIRFKTAGKVYHFDAAGMDLKVYDYAVVQTSRGMEMGQVVIAPRQVSPNEVTGELKPIIRKATEEDVKRAQEFAAREKEAMEHCAKLITKLNLPMKLISAEYNLDGSRLTFFFTAEERVDFRELVRELSSHFKTRIELRQVGPRDEAKLVGGLGRCGRNLCCASFLSEFEPVSIKMAKEQDLPLDPMKISGVCGRLACCLSYEAEQYRAMKQNLPRKNTRVSSPSGDGIVVGGNPLKETVLIELESKATVEVPLKEVTILTEQKATDISRPQKEAPANVETQAKEQKPDQKPEEKAN